MRVHTGLPRGLTSAGRRAILLTMVGTPNTDRVTRRRAATRDEILDAAWRLADQHGLAGFSLRDLAAEVGMRAPSLYEYFEGKHAIYDAMFEQGYREFAGHMAGLRADPADPVGSLAAAGRAFLDFCSARPARYQLLFQRTIPDFEPSERAYAASIEALALGREQFAEVGIAGEAALDLWISIISGLAAQQLANEPGGDRWRRLIDEAARMFVAHQQRTHGQERS